VKKEISFFLEPFSFL